MRLEGVPDDAAVLLCGQVAAALNFRHADGRPNRYVVRRLADEGRIPPPIDPDPKLSYAYQRWSRAEIESYIRGEWVPQAS